MEDRPRPKKFTHIEILVEYSICRFYSSFQEKHKLNKMIKKNNLTRIDFITRKNHIRIFENDMSYLNFFFSKNLLTPQIHSNSSFPGQIESK